MVANERATAADNSYISQCHAQGTYAVGYVPHNHHFLYSAASMAGNSTEAIKGAAGTAAMTVHNPNSDNDTQHFAVQPLFAAVRFGTWQETLDTKAPHERLDYHAGVWHYARGRAFVATGALDSAEAELAALKKIAGKDEFKKGVSANKTAADVLNIAVEVFAGEVVARLGHAAEAVAHLEKGVELEDAMPCREPADWLYPVRHSLGAVLLAAGQAPKAEAVYREDLRRNPENGWALYRLMQALDAQSKKAESGELKKRFDKAWAHADIVLTASRI